MFHVLIKQKFRYQTRQQIKWHQNINYYHVFFASSVKVMTKDISSHPGILIIVTQHFTKWKTLWGTNASQLWSTIILMVNWDLADVSIKCYCKLSTCVSKRLLRQDSWLSVPRSNIRPYQFYQPLPSTKKIHEYLCKYPILK